MKGKISHRDEEPSGYLGDLRFTYFDILMRSEMVRGGKKLLEMHLCARGILQAGSSTASQDLYNVHLHRPEAVQY